MHLFFPSSVAVPVQGRYLVVINVQEILVGGTSAVALHYSGLFTSYGCKLGFMSPTLWQHPEAFTEITQG